MWLICIFVFAYLSYLYFSFFHFYASYLLFYFFFYLLPSRILDPLHFQARGRRRRPNLGLVMVALCNRADHYIFALWFLSSSYFFSSPNLSGRRLDVYRTSTHGVALVQIEDAGLKPAARSSLEMQDAKKSPKIAIWAPSHNFVGLYRRN